jgi:hypothetical protein
MRLLLFVTAATLCSSILRAEEPKRVKDLFKSENYEVAWGKPAVFDPNSELEIGFGDGHGFTLEWLRFLPEPKGVAVLSLKLVGSREPYKSKWEPEVRIKVIAKKASLQKDEYARLLSSLAEADSAQLKPVELKEFTNSSANFWVNTRLTHDRKALLDLDWAGYWAGVTEIEFAKPQAMVDLARESIKGLDFKDHQLTDSERIWVSEKFARDWKKIEKREFYWWVRESYLQLIGMAGDKSALPTLRNILSQKYTKEELRDSTSRCLYFAINAVTRLTKSGIREKPVEKMDLRLAQR